MANRRLVWDFNKKGDTDVSPFLVSTIEQWPRLLKQLRPSAVSVEQWFGHGVSGAEVWVRRDDQLHPIINGNKAYKLASHLDAVGPDATVLSCGGAWSNQLHALACAGKKLGVRTKAVVRGLRNEDEWTPTLLDCRDMGMEIVGVSRQAYRSRFDAEQQADWLSMMEADHWIPEGADDQLGAQGLVIWADLVAQWLREHSVDAVWVDAGTGLSASVLIAMVPKSVTVIVVLVARDASVEARLRAQAQLSGVKVVVISNFHSGGFGRVSPELGSFVSSFNNSQPFRIEPVYSAKLMMAFAQLSSQYGSKHLIIHSGGLQGLRSQTDWRKAK